MEFNLDCKHFRGDKPCRFGQSCPGCQHYSPVRDKIIIIKLAAVGDVLRTTPILPVLKEHHPNAHITWLTDPEAVDLLKNNPHIDRLLTYDLASALRLQVEAFSLLICLDKEARAAALATMIEAERKQGFGLHPTGHIHPFNKEAGCAFELGLNDELKFRINDKSYQEIVFEALGLPYRGEGYVLMLSPEERAYADEVMRRAGWDGKGYSIGIFPGAGSTFANKAWTAEGYAALIDRLSRHRGLRIVLLGGPLETDLLKELRGRVGDLALYPGNDHPLGKFAAIVDHCRMVISGDTVCMHIAIGLEKLVVAIFGPTVHQEIDLYGRGIKIASPVECAPCYRSSCDREGICMKAISTDEVYDSVISLLKENGVV